MAGLHDEVLKNAGARKCRLLEQFLKCAAFDQYLMHALLINKAEKSRIQRHRQMWNKIQYKIYEG